MAELTYTKVYTRRPVRVVYGEWKGQRGGILYLGDEPVRATYRGTLSLYGNHMQVKLEHGLLVGLKPDALEPLSGIEILAEDVLKVDVPRLEDVAAEMQETGPFPRTTEKGEP